MRQTLSAAAAMPLPPAQRAYLIMLHLPVQTMSNRRQTNNARDSPRRVVASRPTCVTAASSRAECVARRGVAWVVVAVLSSSFEDVNPRYP
eukprot:535529-Pleurochrysis_carterae.AAC.1